MFLPTMNYHITTYQGEDYLPLQVAIGSAEYDHWPMGGQTRLAELQGHYAAEGFNPRMRFYAFAGGEMVGFLTTGPAEGQGKAYFEQPYVKRGHEAARDDLIKYALSSLRKLEYRTLILRAGSYWKRSMEVVQRYGFSYRSDLARRGVLELAVIDGGIDNMQTYDHARDAQAIASLYAQLGITKEQAMIQLERGSKIQPGDTITNPWDQQFTLLARLVLYQQQAMGMATVFTNPVFGKDTAILQVFVVHPKADAKQLLGGVIFACKKQHLQQLIVHTGPWGVRKGDDLFKQLGFEFSLVLGYYEKQL